MASSQSTNQARIAPGSEQAKTFREYTDPNKNTSVSRFFRKMDIFNIIRNFRTSLS